MASTTFVTPWSRLRLRPLQAWFLSVFSPMEDSPSKWLTVPRPVAASLNWWLDEHNVRAGMPFHQPQPQVTLTTDASLEGWGAHLLDLVVKDKWSDSDSLLHINALEMLAVEKALRAFESAVTGRVVLLRTDNTTVMYYINKQGGTKSRTLLEITLRIWDWCIQRQVLLQAIHLPGEDNDLADRLSRSPSVCHEWRLHPEAVSVLFDRVVSKMMLDHTDAILITPWWPRQPWFASLLHLSRRCFVRLEPRPDLLSIQDGRILHPDIESLPLVAWRIQP
ncbi:uncharacterized protein LOC121918713 [Sceloporus undulatus]|uniref:uncharacterized protein LOC121918713 n=1 Tax=Sceloporus undulatus TaxID=8520 RepID=UPI001C4B33B9|nr:uncharacterized protein LOC121918713 [Sceloporus undulatus]